MTREAALIALFESCFGQKDQLRMFLAGRTGRCRHSESVQGRPVALGTLTFEAVGALQRRGLDRGFFDRLLDHRPLKKSEILPARALWLRGNGLERDATWGNGRYHLVKEIGRGGFGYVWEAVDKVIGRTVALKVLMEHRTIAASANASFAGPSLWRSSPIRGSYA